MTPVVIAIIGAGPSGVSVLERLGANATELLGGRPLEIHLIDPYPPGPGRVWRHDQSPLLMLNTAATHVTMFTDDSVVCDGPVRSGPSLHTWARERRGGSGVPDAQPEVDTLSATSFPTRRLQSHYLTWVYKRAVAGLPPGSRFHYHRDRAAGLLEAGTRQRIRLVGGRCLVADAVVLAVGHQDVELTPEQERTAAYARRHDLCFLPPGYAADEDLSVLRPGEPVLVRGLGLAFVDLMVLLTQGRGGRHTADGTGALRYTPSGREPVLYVGSRRGVPFPPKLTYSLGASPPKLPRFFSPERILRDCPGPLDFFRDVWPDAAKEIGWGYYHELFTAHPDRVRGDFEEFAEAYAAAEWDSRAFRELLRRTVVHPGDMFDLPRLDRPLMDATFPDRLALQRGVCDHVRDTLRRRSDPRHSADLGATLGLLAVFGQIPVLLESGRFAARSRAADVDGWWAGLFNYMASGPPPRRVRELLALAEAGVVRFVGPDMWVRNADGHFVAGSPAVPGTVTASSLVEARLPMGSAPGSRDPLVRSLYAQGQLWESASVDGGFQHRTGLATVDGQDGAVLDATGRRHPRRFAIGPFTTAVAGGNFTRPGKNPVPSRLTDAVSRSALAAAGSGR